MEPVDQTMLRQWHPAFYAAIQIELEQDADNLIFENEHQLGTKPMEIDVLIIKKNTGRPLQKNIGRMFRRYNIMEYKSPDDYLSIDDFYKVYGYACFYKADTPGVNSVKVEELTITFACSHYPREMIKHLKEHGCEIQEQEPGIYYITGGILPMQLLLLPKLSEQDNLWLRNLTDKLTSAAPMEKLLKQYEENKGKILYQSVMNLIIQANKKIFLEVKNMCEALEELMKDELDARERKGKSDSILELLAESGTITDSLKEKIQAETDMEVLRKWVRLAARASSIEEFAENM